MVSPICDFALGFYLYGKNNIVLLRDTFLGTKKIYQYIILYNILKYIHKYDTYVGVKTNFEFFYETVLL